MATSQKQLDANRANAQHSTGPLSEESKAKTRLNATRDGITGQVTTLSEEDRPFFEELKAQLTAELAPATAFELSLANGIAWDMWRLDRLRAVEMNIYALGNVSAGNDLNCETPQLHTAMTNAKTFSKESAKFALLSTYEQRLNRSIHKNLEVLRELQEERKRNFQADLREETAIARANDLKGLPYKAPERRSRNGFVFSTDQILALANRETIVSTARARLESAPDKVQFDGAYDNFKFNPDNGPNSGLTLAQAA